MKVTKIAFLALLTVSIGSVAMAQSIPMSIGEWAPFTGEKLVGSGMAAEIVTAAGKAGSLAPKYSFVPWKRAEADVQGGTSFATFPYQKTAEREGAYLFSDTLFTSGFTIASVTGNAKTKGFAYGKPADLKGYSVGITAGTDAVKNQLAAAGVTVEESQTPEQLVKKLAAGRIDFAIDDRVVLFLACKAETGTAFTFLEKPFGTDSEFRLMVSKKYPDAAGILAKFNAGLAAIKKDGSLAAILAKYGLK